MIDPISVVLFFMTTIENYFTSMRYCSVTSAINGNNNLIKLAFDLKSMKNFIEHSFSVL